MTRRIRLSTDQAAAHRLKLSCQRLHRAIASGDQHRAEAARADTMKKMALLIEEFGLTEIAAHVLDALPEFDGRHIEEDDDVAS